MNDEIGANKRPLVLEIGVVAEMEMLMLNVPFSMMTRCGVVLFEQCGVSKLAGERLVVLARYAAAASHSSRNMLDDNRHQRNHRIRRHYLLSRAAGVVHVASCRCDRPTSINNRP